MKILINHLIINTVKYKNFKYININYKIKLQIIFETVNIYGIKNFTYMYYWCSG